MAITFERPILNTLVNRLLEPREKIQILSGARQVGKTTIASQALTKLSQPQTLAKLMQPPAIAKLAQPVASAKPTLAYMHVIAESGFTTTWLEQQWTLARAHAAEQQHGAILVIDEIQKIANWSERVKRLWDEDTIAARPLKILLLGSSSLLLHRGLTESMAGRYEIIHVPHWSFAECQNAFDVSLDEYLYFGAYPGALIYRNDEDRFLAYMQESIIEPVVSRDILSQFIVHKPALLRQLFHLGCEYSGQILSYNKMLGQMQDAGNATTLAHYLQLLDQAGVLTGLNKFANEKVRQRKSSPKLQTYNTALMTSTPGIGFNATINNPELKGRLVESAVGASLLMNPTLEVYYWRENNQEVDFIVRSRNKLIAIEVKSGKQIKTISGTETFAKAFAPTNILLVGTGGIPLDMFLQTPLSQFV